MAADISVAMSVSGEKEFKRALEDCKNQLKQLDSGLKANAAEYANNADAMGDNVDRTRMLRQSIETQQKMVKSLGEAIDFSTEKYGANSRQTTQYVVQQNRAREAIAKLERELKDSDREMEELGRDSIKVGRQLENGIGDAAEDAARSLDDMFDQMSRDVGEIKDFVGTSAGMMVAGGIADVVQGAWDAFQGLNDFAEGSRDYRRQLAYLEQNAKMAGQDYEVVKALLFETAAITGEVDGAAEGLNNLLATGFDESELTQAVTALAGAVIKFPDTYKFESLSEGLRETIQQGQASGQFAELLSAMGVNLDDFNKAMSQATTEEERQQIALSFLANHGLEQVYAGYKDANKELTEAEKSTLRMNDAWAMLGATVDKWLTPIRNGIADAVYGFNELLEEGPTEEQNKKWGDWAKTVNDALLAGSTSLGGGALTSEEIAQTPIIGKGLEDTGKALKKLLEEGPTEEQNKKWERWAKVVNDAMLVGSTSLIGGAFGSNEGVKLWGDEAAAEMETEAKAAVENFWEGLSQGLSAYGATYSNQGEMPGIYQGVKAMMEMIKGEGETEGEEAGTTGGEAVIDGAAQALEDGGSDMKTALSNALIEGANAFGEATPGMTAAAQAMANAISNALSTIQFPDVSGWFNNASKATGSPSMITLPTGGGGGTNVRQTSSATINLSVNGSKFASAIIDDINAAQGKTVALA